MHRFFDFGSYKAYSIPSILLHHGLFSYHSYEGIHRTLKAYWYPFFAYLPPPPYKLSALGIIIHHIIIKARAN